MVNLKRVELEDLSQKGYKFVATFKNEPKERELVIEYMTLNAMTLNKNKSVTIVSYVEGYEEETGDYFCEDISFMFPIKNWKVDKRWINGYINPKNQFIPYNPDNIADLVEEVTGTDMFQQRGAAIKSLNALYAGVVSEVFVAKTQKLAMEAMRKGAKEKYYRILENFQDILIDERTKIQVDGKWILK